MVESTSGAAGVAPGQHCAAVTTQPLDQPTARPCDDPALVSELRQVAAAQLRGRSRLTDPVRHVLNAFVPTHGGRSKIDAVMMRFFIRGGRVYLGRLAMDRQRFFLRERTEAFQCMLARLAARMKLPDAELYIFINDDIRVRLPTRLKAMLPTLPIFEPEAPKGAAALLAPDFAFEAWPSKRVCHYERTHATLLAATARHGSPGAPDDGAAWLRRPAKLFWRGGLEARAKYGREGYAALTERAPDEVDVARGAGGRKLGRAAVNWTRREDKWAATRRTLARLPAAIRPPCPHPWLNQLPARRVMRPLSARARAGACTATCSTSTAPPTAPTRSRCGSRCNAAVSEHQPTARTRTPLTP